MSRSTLTFYAIRFTLSRPKAGIDDVIVDRAEGVADAQREAVFERRRQADIAQENLFFRGFFLGQKRFSWAMVVRAFMVGA